MGNGAWKEDGGIRGWGDGGKEELLSPSSGHLPTFLPPHLLRASAPLRELIQKQNEYLLPNLYSGLTRFPQQQSILRHC